MSQIKNSPLAEILRPKVIDDIIGQQHILGKGQSLRVSIESGNLPSLILWGPPGVGKTTIAHVISQSVNYEFFAVSAVLSGIKEIREAKTSEPQYVQDGDQYAMIEEAPVEEKTSNTDEQSRCTAWSTERRYR